METTHPEKSEAHLVKAIRIFLATSCVLLDMSLLPCFFILHEKQEEWNSLLFLFIVAWLVMKFEYEYKHALFKIVERVKMKIL